MADLVQVDLVTPEKLFASTSARLVEVPGEAGDFGVLPGHAPLISSIRPGVVTLHGEGDVRERYLVVGGISEVTGERCTVLAEYVEDVSSVTVSQATERAEKAKKAVADAISDEEKRDATRELEVSEALALALAA